MAITLDELEGRVKEAFGDDFKYRKIDEKNVIVVGFGTENYKDGDGDKSIQVVIRLDNDGEFINFFAPNAFNIKDKNKRAFLEACAIVQNLTKMVQFEFDHNDGEVRPIIELPLEDNTFTARQLRVSLVGLIKIVDEYYEFLINAGDNGAVDLQSLDRSREEKKLAMLRQMAASMGVDLEQLGSGHAAKSSPRDEDVI